MKHIGVHDPMVLPTIFVELFINFGSLKIGQWFDIAMSFFLSKRDPFSPNSAENQATMPSRKCDTQRLFGEEVDSTLVGAPGHGPWFPLCCR